MSEGTQDQGAVASLLPTEGQDAEVLALRAALKALTAACETADAHEELSDWVDGSLLDAANAALDLQYPVIWTPEQVALLEARQAAPMSHPYTCGGNRSDALHKAQAEEDGDDDTGILIPTVRGWICPACDYRQFWAHEVPHQPPVSPAEQVGWRAIETAPKDGTEVILYRAGWQEAPRGRWGQHDGEDENDKPTVFGGWFMASEWVTYGCEDGFLGWNEDADVMPTHWMPLPTPPAEGSV